MTSCRAGTSIVNIFTVDVEDWYCSHFLEKAVPPSTWDRQPSIVQEGTEAILSLLREYGVRATFFVLGYVADRHPDLCRRIASAGHEIGTHGFWHRRPQAGSPLEFQQDLEESLRAIIRATETTPRGYRAPVAALDWRADWPFQAMRRAGLTYDSSVYPTRVLVHAGSPHAPREPYLTRSGVWEIPLSVASLLGLRLPLSGGFYLRAVPFGLYRRLIRQENAAGRPAMIYIHPRGLAHRFPIVTRHPIGRAVQTSNVRLVEPRLRALFEEFRWTAIEDVYGSLLASQPGQEARVAR